jgi:hypothetical protein
LRIVILMSGTSAHGRVIPAFYLHKRRPDGVSFFQNEKEACPKRGVLKHPREFRQAELNFLFYLVSPRPHVSKSARHFLVAFHFSAVLL